MDEINTALSKWSALTVTAEVEEWMEPELFGKQRKAIKKQSQSMGGVVLNVVDGVCCGRAASEEEARDATRKLEERVREGIPRSIGQGGAGESCGTHSGILALFWRPLLDTLLALLGMSFLFFVERLWRD